MFGTIVNNPAAWIGVGALAAPLMIHLLTRRTPRRIVFPTIRFLKQAQANFSSLFRVRHWLLLAVRTLLIAAVLAAFLRPSLQRGSVAAQPNAKQRAVAIVIDASLSMGYTHGGGGPWMRARQATEKILDSLATGDRATLIAAGTLATAALEEPSGNLFQLKRELRELKPSLERADFDAAIGEALRQLAPIQGARKEIHLVSDFQRGNWEALGPGRIPAGIETVFVAVADPNAGNCAVIEMQAIPAAPMVGEPVDIVCKVANYGKTPAKIPLTLTLGEEAPLSRELDLASGSVVSTTFRIRARKTGLFEGMAAIPADELPADDKRFLTLEVHDRIETLVLTDEAPRDPQASHAYLARALDPFGGGRGGTLHCTSRAPDALTALDLSRSQLVFVCGAREMTEATVRLLLDYLKQGGSVIVFLETYADKVNLATLARLAGKDLTLPFEPGTQKDLGAVASYAVFTGADFDDPMLRPFRDANELGQIRFRRLFATEHKESSGQRLLKFDDGSIALGRETVGQGSLLLCNFSPSPADSDLIKRTLFVPLVHQMAGAMRPHAGLWRNPVVGEACQIPLALPSADALPELFSPSNATLDAVIDRGQGELAGRGQALMIHPRLRESGFYRVRDGQRALATVAANVDRRESNLEPLNDEELRRLATVAGRPALMVDATDPGALDQLVEGRALWPSLLMAGLGLLALEQLLTLYWRR